MVSSKKAKLTTIILMENRAQLLNANAKMTTIMMMKKILLLNTIAKLTIIVLMNESRPITNIPIHNYV